MSASQTIARWMPRMAFAAATVLYAALVYLGTARPPVFEMDRFDLSDALFVTAVYMFAVMGAVVATKRPGHRMGLIFLATGLLAMVSYGGFEYSVAAVYGSRDLPLGDEVVWLGMWGWIPMTGGISLVLLSFPNGRLLSRPWVAPLALIAIGGLLAFVGSLGFRSQSGRSLLELTTSETVPRLPGVSDISHTMLAAANPFVLAGIFISIFSVIVRFIRSRGDERQQMKGLLYASILLIFGGLVDALVPAMLGAAYESTFDALPPMGLVAVPVAAGIAVLKYRLYDIDLVIHRTLVYAALTGLLILIYLAIVFVFQTLLTGITTESDLAVAASTLAVAALFRPLRARVQGFIDRRFYREKYDAQHTLESFTSRLRNEVDLDHLVNDLSFVVRETMHPAHVSVWMRSGRPAGSGATP